MESSSPTYSKSELLQLLFAFLENNNLEYCVVGDSDSLPISVPSDVDIVITHKEIGTIRSKMSQFALEHHCQIPQILQHECDAFYFVLSWWQDGKLLFLHPDICGDYFRQGKLLLRAEDILRNRRPSTSENGKNRGFYVPATEMEFIYYLLKKN